MRPNDMPRPFAPDHSEEAAMGDLIERLQLASTKLGALFGHMLDILGRDGVREIGLDPDSDSDVFKEAADELARLRAEVGELDDMRMQLAGLTAIYENQTAYTIAHGGRGIACNDAMRQAYSDQKVRAETAERERDELRRRIAEAEVVTIQSMPSSAFGVFVLAPEWVGKHVALVVLDAEEAK